LKKGGWYAHETRDAAIKILNAGIRPSSFGCGPGYAWVDLECCRVVSGYASPNATLGEFHAFLDRIRGIISGSRKQVLLAGDFNAKSAAWGSRSEDHRGEALADLLAESDMVVQNRGCDPTFSGPHGNSTIDDLAGEDIVLKLIHPVEGTNRNITGDNWFTSLLSVNKLLREKKVTYIGTLRKNKTEILHNFCQTRTDKKSRPCLVFERI
jgi:hypothetical protein